MSSIFKNIENKQLLTKDNTYYQTVYKETKNLDLYLNESIKEFHKIFNINFNNFNDALNYLEINAIPNNCVCAGVIEIIPGWKCVECSRYENSIYCNNCYIKSKHLHKGHTIHYLPNSGGMCDCGDPDALTTFCPEHSGPHTNQNDINEYISKSFPKNILTNLIKFFNIFFQKFSKYLMLLEQFDYFYQDKFEEHFGNNNQNDKNLIIEKEDIILLKNNFGIIFQNLLDFLRLITEKNLGMLYLVSTYFLNNHLSEQILEDEYYSIHRCIKVYENNIEIIYKEKQSHICQCPFLRLLMSNWRNNIKSDENESFLLSFSRNLPLRSAFCIIFFFLYKENMLNDNGDIISNRTQFLLEDITILIAEKTNLFEETFDWLYEYLSKYKNKFNSLDDKTIEAINFQTKLIRRNSQYFSKYKVRQLLKGKISFIKKIIDCLCLIHNQMEFKSIYPHPVFQNRGFFWYFAKLELKLLSIVEIINIFTGWDNIDNLKEIFKYLINKILYQEKAGVKQLKNDEYSFHLSLYRCFGLLINYFCFYYAFNNKCSLYDSAQFFKKNFFESYNQIETFTDIIIKDYFRFFGFVSGTKIGYFNYYEDTYYYSNVFFLDQRPLKMDFTLLKYLFILSEKSINIDTYLKISNLENVYSSFEKIFLLNDNNNKNIKNNINNNKNISFETPINNFDIIFNNLNIQENTNQVNEIDNDDIYKNIMQCKLLLEILIILMKDDSSIYWSLIRSFKKTISSKTKKALFDEIRNNKNAIKDLENVLKEKLIHEIVTQGNLTDLTKIKEKIDNYLLLLFEEKEFNKILEELTYNKINGETKMFYLKDSILKYLDMNYYCSPIAKSNAQKYILDFKKDLIKPYNYYYFKPSELTFDLFENTYEKILLNKNNLVFMIKILENVLPHSMEHKVESLKLKSITNSLLPTILNYLSIFGCINTKSFIKFKIENEELINKLNTIFSNVLINNEGNTLLEKELEENVKEVIKQINKYKIIIKSINNDGLKLDNYDYNINLDEKLRENNTNNINKDNNENKKDNKKSKNMKDKFKKIMNKKTENFLEKIQQNNDMLNAINDLQSHLEEDNNKNDEIMCYYCRNPIHINSYEVPYVKIGSSIKDNFYRNSMNATILSELSKMTEITNEENLLKIIKEQTVDIGTETAKIISCGHFFHLTCFNEGYGKYFDDIFKCPLCLKNQNSFIPPLNNFHNKYNFLKSEKITELFHKNKIEKYIIDKDAHLFKFVTKFFYFNSLINDFDLVNSDYNFLQNLLENNSILNDIFPWFHNNLNYLENIFFFKGTTFYKLQQIDNIQNFILSCRYFIKNNIMDVNILLDYIQKQIFSLTKGPEDNEDIMNNYEKHFYINSLEEIMLCLALIFDYEEMKDIIKYIIYFYHILPLDFI